MLAGVAGQVSNWQVPTHNALEKERGMDAIIARQIYDSLIAVNRRAFQGNLYEVCYHALAGAGHAAYSARVAGARDRPAIGRDAVTIARLSLRTPLAAIQLTGLHRRLAALAHDRPPLALRFKRLKALDVRIS